MSNTSKTKITNINNYNLNIKIPKDYCILTFQPYYNI